METVTISTEEYRALQDLATRIGILMRFVKAEDEESKKGDTTGMLYTSDIRKIIGMGEIDV